MLEKFLKYVQIVIKSRSTFKDFVITKEKER